MIDVCIPRYRGRSVQSYLRIFYRLIYWMNKFETRFTHSIIVYIHVWLLQKNNLFSYNTISLKKSGFPTSTQRPMFPTLSTQTFKDMFDVCSVHFTNWPWDVCNRNSLSLSALRWKINAMMSWRVLAHAYLWVEFFETLDKLSLN